MEKLVEKIPVIDARFCSAHYMNLIVKLEKGFFKITRFKVHDPHGNQLLEIVKGDTFLNRDWLIRDATDSPIATIFRKTFSWDDVWRVYEGKNVGKEEGALLKVKRQDKHTLNVFVGPNLEERAKKSKKGDFDVVGFPPTFYMNDTIIASVNNDFSWGGDLGGKGGFKVRVNGGIDYVFIVALIIIQSEMAVTDTFSSDNALLAAHAADSANAAHTSIAAHAAHAAESAYAIQAAANNISAAGAAHAAHAGHAGCGY